MLSWLISWGKKDLSSSKLHSIHLNLFVFFMIFDFCRFHFYSKAQNSHFNTTKYNYFMTVYCLPVPISINWAEELIHFIFILQWIYVFGLAPLIDKLHIIIILLNIHSVHYKNTTTTTISPTAGVARNAGNRIIKWRFYLLLLLHPSLVSLHPFSSNHILSLY